MLDRISIGQVLNVGVCAMAALAPRFAIKSSCVVIGAYVGGTIAACASFAITEFQLQRIAQTSSQSFFLAEMLAYGGRACMTLGATGCGASLGLRLAQQILGNR